MLGSQNCFYDKAGVGYDGSNDDPHDKKKKVAKPFVKEGTVCDGDHAESSSGRKAPDRKKKASRPFVNKTCYKCRNKGHLAYDCGTQNNRSKIRNPFLVTKQVWVLKGSLKGTNAVSTQGVVGT